MNKTSYFIVPRESTAWRGNEAGWITTSGWAAAGKQLWGDARVATPDGVFTPEESRLFPRKGTAHQAASKKWRSLAPEVLITAYKDYKLWRSRPKQWPIEADKWMRDTQAALVWERHDIFHGPGRKLADAFGVPLITSVEAVVVWEARKWGVHRPIYGSWLERREAESLRRSDLVMCVSEDVRRRVIELGVPDSKVIVTPNRVDSSLFHPQVDGGGVRKQYKLEGKTVIGWTGSFRRFHGLDIVLEAFSEVKRNFPDSILMLVGDGQEFEPIRKMAIKLGLQDAVLLTGRQPFTSIPGFVAAFDIGLVSAASSHDFHYSPLKLREYLAVGRAIVAPEVGDLPQLFRQGEDLLFYNAGDAGDLAVSLMKLLGQPELKQKLERSSRKLFMEGGTWVHELKSVCKRLGIPVSESEFQ